jgi:hypothetical protein
VPDAQWKADYHAALIEDALDALSQPGAVDPSLAGGLRLYLADRVETGGFLRAVLENDFQGAIARAHPCLTLAALKGLAQLIYTTFPATSHGSPEAVRAWLAEAKEPANG